MLVTALPSARGPQVQSSQANPRGRDSAAARRRFTVAGARIASLEDDDAVSRLMSMHDK